MKVRNMIEMLEAYEAGRTVQFKSKGSDMDWTDLTIKKPAFNFHATKYRVKPEPRVFWITLDSAGCIHSVNKKKPVIRNTEAIKVVEEIDE